MVSSTRVLPRRLVRSRNPANCCKRERSPQTIALPPLTRAQVVECVATASSIYISSQFGMTLMNSGVTPVAAYVGIFNAIFLMLFIYATATATGGHLNPMITFTTVLCGLTPIPRGKKETPKLLTQTDS